MNWYALRTRPGSQSMARPLPAPTSDIDAQHIERRRCETIIERNLREAGIDVYMPAFWREVRLHRSRKLRERRLPLLVGYVFIRHDPLIGFGPVRDVAGVIDVVRNGSVPAVFAEEEVRAIMLDMFHQHQEYLYRKARRVETARFSRRQTLNAELGRHLPKGRGRTISLRAYADECIDRLDPQARKRVLGIMAAIDGLEANEGLDEFREAV